MWRGRWEWNRKRFIFFAFAHLLLESSQKGQQVPTVGAHCQVASVHWHEVQNALIAGIENFKGHYIHSRDYKNTSEFVGKRGIVVGIGNSGVDIAVEISHVASQVGINKFLA